MKYLESVSLAVGYIESHLREPISVTQICEQTAISSWHFQRVFREYTGESIGSYLRRRRLANASDALKNSALRIIDIAVEFQFGSSEAFSRAFKNEFGLSPQSFRDAPIQIHSFKKPELKFESLNYIAQDMNLAPEIKIIESILVAGLNVSFVSPLAKSHDYMNSVDQVWKQFVKGESGIENRVGEIKVGLIPGLSALHHPHDEMMNYMACTPISKLGNLPEHFKSVVIPGGQYAVFRAKGFHKQTQYMIDYVYSTWLPQSQFRRGNGPEFTWLDHRVEPLSPETSQVDYYLPILK